MDGSPAGPAPAAVLQSLGQVAASRGLADLAGRLAALQHLVHEDLAACADAFARSPRDGLVRTSAGHLLDLGGKRLRPVCVALCARLGSGFGPAARELAIAAELVHSATLLHDDVVDVGDTRRGAPTARTLYGNAASIFAGDWLLVDALRRVREAGVPDTLERLLTAIDEMIAAEALQLEGRGRLRAERDAWLRVARGKTGALFGWACFAGARAGGLDERECAALEQYGLELGVAFQLVDDLLDVEGDAAATGKAPFADLREGKAAFPVVVALERAPHLRPVFERLASERGAPDAADVSAVRDAFSRTGAVEACRTLAREYVAGAVARLAPLPAGPARDALETAALAALHRDR